MMYRIVCLVAFLVLAKGESDDNPFQALQDLVDEAKSNSTLLAAFEEHFKAWANLSTDAQVPSFPCDLKAGGRSPVQPKSVHTLRPGDIDIVAAIGDSLSAAACAKATSILNLIFEWRGISWSAGGDSSLAEGVITLPNVIKMFNPKLKGYSTGVIPVKTQDLFPQQSRLNMAVSGAKSKDILKQAENLVSKIKKDKTINFNNDWKLVTLFIGGNDLCAYCKDQNQFSFPSYVKNIEATLDYLQQNLPRTFVNLVLMLDVSQLSRVNSGFVCSILHQLMCKCASYPKTEEDKQLLVTQVVEFSESILQLLDDPKYGSKEDFTVVAQPFFVNQRLPSTQTGQPDLSYFSPDCFHFSAKGHASAAQAIWNNMVEPAGRKRLSWFPNNQWKCPSTGNPYLFTYQNSFTDQSNGSKSFGSSSNRMESKKPESSKQLQFEDSETAYVEADHQGPVASKLMIFGGFVAGMGAAMAIAVAAWLVKRRNSPTGSREKTPLLYDTKF